MDTAYDVVVTPCRREAGERQLGSARGSSRTAAQRGATMVGVMLLTVSLMTLGLVVVRSSVREVTQAGRASRLRGTAPSGHGWGLDPWYGSVSS